MDDIKIVKETVKRMQKTIFRIMCDIDDFCRDNNIRYFLSGGTCLGAVRHKGFIPWDDDADLMMPRKDYERFISLFAAAYPEKYGLGALPINSKWQRQYVRVWDKKSVWKSTNVEDLTMGIFVDIFPIDGLPENKFKRKIFYSCITLLRGIGNACIKKEYLPKEGYRFIKKITGFVFRPLGMRFFTKLMDRIARRYDFDKSKYVGASLAAHYGERETIEREEMASEVRLPFEGHLFPVPKGYHKYLSNLYGDYMTIPKDAEEKGYSHLGHWIIEFLED